MIGGGLNGLLAGMMLAGDGHDVTVLERDPSPPTSPATAWDDWDRSSVRQFRMGHLFLPPFRAALAANLPQVVEALRADGALSLNPIEAMPAQFSGGWRENDERFEILTGSRPMVEATIARCAAETPGLTITRGVTVKRLLTEPGSDPVQVTGVEADTGDRYLSDLVVDAAGRSSGLPRLLATAGAESPVDEMDDSGFVYYGRAFRAPNGEVPPALGGGLQPYGSISTLTLAADNGTWAVAFVASGRDRIMRKVRNEQLFEKLWRSYPLVAHWLDGEPMSDIEMMGNIEDRIRHFVVGGKPIATGVVAVGDSWACTNPSVGRGASMGLLHVVGLRDLLRDHPVDDATAFALAWHSWTRENVEPFYRETVRGDRHRLAQIEAVIDGSSYKPDDPIMDVLDALPTAAMKDPDLMRTWLDGFMMNRLNSELLSDQELVAHALELGTATGEEPAPGLSRSQLEALLA